MVQHLELVANSVSLAVENDSFNFISVKFLGEDTTELVSRKIPKNAPFKSRLFALLALHRSTSVFCDQTQSPLNLAKIEERRLFWVINFGQKYVRPHFSDCHEAHDCRHTNTNTNHEYRNQFHLHKVLQGFGAKLLMLIT